MAHSEDRDLIVRYLLNQLSEPERELFRQKILQQEEFFELARSIEDELLSSFVRGELQDPERRQLEQGFLRTPGGRKKLQLFQELNRVVEKDRSMRSAGRTSSRIGGGWIAAAVVLFVAALLSGYSAFVLMHRNRQLEEVRSEVSRLTRRLDALKAQIEQEEDAARATRAASGPDPGSTSAATPPRPVQSLPAAWLNVGAKEGGAKASKVRLPRTAATLELRLRLAGKNEFSSYDAQLQSPGGDTILTRQGLTRQEFSGIMAVVLRVPAADLRPTPGTYRVTLSGHSTGGSSPPIGSYSFAIEAP